MLHNKMLVLSSLLTMASASAAVVQLDQLTSDQLLSPYN